MSKELNALLAMTLVTIIALVATSLGFNGEIIKFAIVAVTALGGVELYQRMKDNGAVESDIRGILQEVKEKLDEEK